MEWKYTFMVTVLLISAMSMAGCTGPSPAPVATPAPVPAATSVPTMAPATTAAPAVPSVTWPTLETPATGHPYSKTYSFQGTGDYDELTFSTASDATWVFQLTYPKQGVFIVMLKNERGEDVQVLANGAGSSTVQKSVWLKAGNYYFNIAADAPWYITMSTS
jgi:hypothetical protein